NGPGVRIAQVSCGAGLAMALGWRPLLVVMRAIVPFFGTFHPHEGLYVYVFGVAALAGLGLTRARGWLADRRHGARWANSAASLLTVGQAGQLILFGWNINPQHPAEAAWLFPSTPLVEALQASIGDGRMLPVRWHLPGVWTPPVLAGKTPGAFGLRSGSGYESVIPRRTAMFWAAVEAGQVPPEAPAGGFKTDFWHDRLPFGLMEKASVKLLAVPPGIRPLDVSGADPGREGLRGRRGGTGAEGELCLPGGPSPRGIARGALRVSALLASPRARRIGLDADTVDGRSHSPRPVGDRLSEPVAEETLRDDGGEAFRDRPITCSNPSPGQVFEADVEGPSFSRP